MIIGEAPGRNEIEQGIPFCGASGRVLDTALGLASVRRGNSYPRDSYYITNLYKGDVGVDNRNPTSDEIAAHRFYLREELDTVRPLGILLLGRVAGQAFIPELDRMGDYVGRRIQWEGIQLFPCWHPAYTLYNREALADFQFTVAKFVLVTQVLDAHS
jgi:DNA polymerase